MTQKAYFLWLGSTLPDLARVSVLSSAEAGFETVLFVDRQQDVQHPNLKSLDWREVEVGWAPEQVRLRGQLAPCYAAFSDLFRYAVLAQSDGWWFDCDTIVMRHVDDFADLVLPNALTLGRESTEVVNGAVIGSASQQQAGRLLDEAQGHFPVLERWGVVGPSLITACIDRGVIAANVLEQHTFYPVHHSQIARLYQPVDCDMFLHEEPNWYCLSLWGEVLMRAGFCYLTPPKGSFLDDFLRRRPELGQLRGDPAKLADFLARNIDQIGELDSGRAALRTVMRKIAARLPTRAS